MVAAVLGSLTAAQISAAATAVGAGTSLAGTTISGLVDNTGYSVACGIEMENWTKWSLVDPATHIHGGKVKIPATVVAPGKQEAMVTHKNGHTATGTYGTVSWKVRATFTFYIIVMWSVPFDQNTYKNWLGIGITTNEARAHDDGLFKSMYYEEPTDFVRKDYYSSSMTIRYNNSLVDLSATMGTSHKPTVKMVVVPKKTKDLAHALKANIGALVGKSALKRMLRGGVEDWPRSGAEE